MKIGFFTYGDSEMGMGHIYRALALAEGWSALDQGAQVSFELLPGEPGWKVVEAWRTSARFPCEVNQVARGAIPQGPWDVLFVDQLAVPPSVMEGLRPRARCLVSLDDVGEGHWRADISINVLYRCRVPRPQGNRTLSRGGLEYAIFSPSLVDKIRECRLSRPVARKLWLTQGGADTYGVLPRLVRALAPLCAREPELEAHVHVGPAFAHHERLDEAISSFPGKLVVHERVPDLFSLMREMDVAVAAGGILTLELAALRVPTVGITAEKKELETLEWMALQGCVANLGEYSPEKDEQLRVEIGRLVAGRDAREALSFRAAELLDGQGTERVLGEVATFLTRSIHGEMPGLSP